MFFCVGFLGKSKKSLAVKIKVAQKLSKKKNVANADFLRSITIHPTLPYVLTSSDDMSIKLWDWERNWENTIIFEGHTHYVMQIEINPKESNTFASG